MENLQKIIKAFKGKPCYARVGILADTNARSDGQSNAQIGAANEFGSVHVPVRSFLRVPIEENASAYLENSRGFSEDTLKAVVKTASFKPWAEVIGETGLQIVQDAFDTSGFGKWPRDKNGQHQSLMHTGQLRDSVSFDVKEGS